MKDFSAVLGLLLSSFEFISVPSLPCLLIPFPLSIYEALTIFQRRRWRNTWTHHNSTWKVKSEVQWWNLGPRICQGYALWPTHSFLFSLGIQSYQHYPCFNYLLLHKLCGMKQQHKVIIPQLRMSYISQSPFLFLNLSCMWGLGLSHVCGFPIHMYALNLVSSLENKHYYYFWLCELTGLS